MAFIIAVGLLAALTVPLASCYLVLKKLNYDLQRLYGDF